MKKLWDKDYQASIFNKELAEQAHILDRPVLQDIANVLCIVVNCNGDWMAVLRTVIPQVLNTGPSHSMVFVDADVDADAGSVAEDIFRGYCLYALELVSEIRNWLKSGVLEYPKMVSSGGCTLEDVMEHYHSEDKDDLARCIARHINYVTAGVEHPWNATNIISRNTLKLTRALQWWTND